MSVRTGLRAQKKEQTRRLLMETAGRLFAEKGFESVRIGEVAVAAGVSEATVFNYFPAKEDLVYGRMQDFEEAMLQAVRTRPAGEPVLTAFRRFVLADHGLLAGDGSTVLDLATQSARAIAGSPALLAREAQILARYAASLQTLLAGELGVGPDDPRPGVTADALVGVHGALLRFARAELIGGRGGDPRFAARLRGYGEAALELLAGGLAGYGRKPGEPANS